MSRKLKQENPTSFSDYKAFSSCSLLLSCRMIQAGSERYARHYAIYVEKQCFMEEILGFATIIDVIYFSTLSLKMFLP